ncbi:unnamed protein product [Meloidogyne enterolobii]|uniref:Uncharacterized protein n=2 Tax=Meloidogyne enterolobii TaxID=390850 RepID=A0A6V7XPL2_MELEN|nr:unnamed protein product [Meloidogyne enterolobii]
MKIFSCNYLLIIQLILILFCYLINSVDDKGKEKLPNEEIENFGNNGEEEHRSVLKIKKEKEKEKIGSSKNQENENKTLKNVNFDSKIKIRNFEENDEEGLINEINVDEMGEDNYIREENRKKLINEQRTNKNKLIIPKNMQEGKVRTVYARIITLGNFIVSTSRWRG